MRCKVVVLLIVLLFLTGCGAKPQAVEKAGAGKAPESTLGEIKRVSDELVDVPIPPLTKSNDSFNIKFLADGAFTVGDSPQVPKIYQDGNDGSARYGYIAADPIELKDTFQSIVFTVDGVETWKSGMILLDVRASSDKSNWSEFLPAFEINGEERNQHEVTFYNVPGARFIEYRLSILCNAADKPVIKKISLKVRGEAAK